jgi:hypothetical protein
MKKLSGLLLLVGMLSFGVCAQKDSGPKAPVVDKAAADAANKKAAELAKATLTAHGGEKLSRMKSLFLSGSVDVTSSTFNQPIPATFVLVTAGDRYRFELNNPIQPIKQVFDGRQTYSTAQGLSLPPMTSLGFPLLSRIGETGFIITAVPEAKRKRAGFRITTPSGYYTDFFVDEKTNLLKAYESSYDIDGRVVTTSAEIDKFRTVDGLLVPEKYAQRFDLGTMTAYANFKVVQILVNSTLTDDVFSLPS